MNAGNAFSQWLMSGILMLGCGGGALALSILFLVMGIKFWGTRDALFVVGFPLFLPAAIAIVWLSLKVTKRSNRWVELDGDVIRACNLYTGRITERTVWEIDEIITDTFQVASVAVHLTEAIHGRIRGFAIMFPDFPGGIRVFQPEMKNVSPLIEAIVAKMGERGVVVPEIMNLEGRPMVRRLLWHQRPAP